MTTTAPARRAELDYATKDMLVNYVATTYRTIDNRLMDFADVDGLDRDDLVDLILRAEYPEGRL